MSLHLHIVEAEPVVYSTYNRCVIFDLPGRKPCWCSEKKLLLSICCITHVTNRYIVYSCWTSFSILFCVLWLVSITQLGISPPGITGILWAGEDLGCCSLNTHGR